MSAELVTAVHQFAGPFGQQIELQDVRLGRDVRLLRLRIREGSRFTVFDLDPATAQDWGRAMADWADGTGLLEKT